MENLSPEILFKILLNTDYHSILNYCSANSSIRNLCSDEYFWKRKLDRDYPGLRQYKPGNLTYQQQYASLYNLPTTGEAIWNRRLDQVILLHRNGEIPDYDELNTAAEHGDMAILNYYADNADMSPHPDAYYYAAVNNHIDILDWLYSKGVEIPFELIVDGIGDNLINALIGVLGFCSLTCYFMV